jgi:hypothetical protein
VPGVSVIDTWGSSVAERAADYPCDELIEGRHRVVFRAVDVNAPAAILFRWLCQMRVAPYSYDWIDNLGRRSPQELTPGADELEPGQRMVSVFRLADFGPGHQLTLEQNGGLLGHVALTYLVKDRGEDHSRLVLRIAWGPPRVPLARPLLSAGDLVMARRQLLNFKALAERDAHIGG